MSKITNEWIEAGAVDGSSIKLKNAQTLKARNFADDGDVDILQVDVNDKIVFPSVPQVASDPSANNDLVRKSYADDTYIASSLIGAVSGVCPLDTDQLVPIANIPPAALERLVVVADQTARYALTTTTVQNGDTVKQTDTGEMWFVKDDTKLDQTGGYAVYTAGVASAVPWGGITSKPTTLSGFGITDAVPSSRTVNGHALSSDVSVTKSDVSLGNVDNVQQLPMSYLDTSTSLGTSDIKVPSQNAVKSYVDTAIGGITSTEAYEDIITLSSGDISAGYVDLSYKALAGSVTTFPKGGPVQVLTDDYTLSYTGGTGGVTRLTFAGDLASTLVAGMKLVVKYLKG